MRVLKGRMAVAPTIWIALLVTVLEEQEERDKARLWPHCPKRAFTEGAVWPAHAGVALVDGAVLVTPEIYVIFLVISKQIALYFKLRAPTGEPVYSWDIAQYLF